MSSVFSKYLYWTGTFILDHLPNSLYYSWIYYHRLNDFKVFKKQCCQAGIPLPSNVQLASMKPRKYKKVLTVGVYDLLHKGHVELYRRAKGLGDYLIVAAQDSDYILKYKPNAKILNSTEDRKYMIKAIRYVDEGFLRAIKWCEEHGKEHIVLGRTIGVSSSELKAKIAAKTKNI